MELSDEKIALNSNLSYSILLSFMATVVATLGLLGWEFDQSNLYKISGTVAMMPSTSYLILLITGAIIIEYYVKTTVYISFFLYIVASLISSIILYCHLFLSFEARYNFLLGYIGGTSPQSALTFLLLSLSGLLGLDIKKIRTRTRIRNIDQWILVIAFLLIFFVLSGHLYDVIPLIGVSKTIGMSINTSIAALLIVFSLFLKTRDRGIALAFVEPGIRSSILKKFIASSFLFPIIVAILILYGKNIGLYNLGFSNSLFISIVSTGFAIIVWFGAKSSKKLEQKSIELFMQKEKSKELEVEVESLEYYQMQLKAFAGKILNAQEAERKKISREMHDEFGQSLMGLKLDLFNLGENIPNEASSEELISNMEDSLNSSIDMIRRISRELRPSVLDDLGLESAIEWQLNEFSKRSKIKCDLNTCEIDIDLDKDISVVAFRILQESLTNIARHSEASSCLVSLSVNDNFLKLIVEDNGKGFDQNRTDKLKSIGLIGMKERASLLNGSVEVEGHIGEGTKIILQLPIGGVTQ